MVLELRKGQPDVGDVHVPTTERKRRRRRARSLLHPRFQKHYGPGPHRNGSPQSVHGGSEPGWLEPYGDIKARLSSEPDLVPKVRRWAQTRIDGLRAGGTTPEEGEEIHYLVNLYYTAVNLQPHSAEQWAVPAEDMTDSLAFNDIPESWLTEALNESTASTPDFESEIRYKVDEVHPGSIIFTTDGPFLLQEIIRSSNEMYEYIGVDADGNAMTRFYNPDGDAPPHLSVALLEEMGVAKHYGPGNHPSGTPQSVHGSGSRGTSASKLKTRISGEGGFSVDAISTDHPTTGFMVSLKGFEESFPASSLTEDRLRQYRARNWSVFADVENTAWGAWYDSESDQVYLDISVNFSDLDEAVDSARQWEQLAIFDLGSFTEIRLDDDGSSLSDFQAKMVDA